MECTKTLDTKYQNLATEYSKLRANAAVLKKAVLEEQARSRDLKEQLKEHEQRLRKSNQEMESLTFRNQQLTKRISILQEELDVKTTGRRYRGKSTDANMSTMSTNVTLLDEELHKKIMDNAQLISAMTDKELEISNLREIISELEEKLFEEQRQRSINEKKHNEEMEELCKHHMNELKLLESRTAGCGDMKQNGDILSDKGSIQSSEDGIGDVHIQCSTLKQQTLQLQNQVEHWRTEYELLLSKHETQDGEKDEETDPQCEQKTKDYFYQRIDGLMAERQQAEGMTNSLMAELGALQVRLELSLEEKDLAEDKLETTLSTMSKLQEELQTTSHNYEQQLSTMSEHLADLNDKYTEQCELIQQLTFQLQGAKLKKNTK